MHLWTIIIPAGGLGTRLLPAPKTVQREPLNNDDCPILQFAIDEAIDDGAEQIIVVIHPEKLAIRDYLKPNPEHIGRLGACGMAMPGAALAAVQVAEMVNLRFAFQNPPTELVHSISPCSAMVLPGSFGVILPDDVMICCAWLTQMAQAYTYSHGVVEMTVLEQDAPLYGICRLLDAPSGRLVGVSGIVETPKAATEPPLLADFGRHVVDPVMFSIALGIPHSDIGEVQLPDPITVDAARVKMTALQFSGQRFVGGSHDELIGAGLARQRVVKRQRNGALFGLDAFKRQVRINDTPPSARRLDGRATALEGSAT